MGYGPTKPLIRCVDASKNPKHKAVTDALTIYKQKTPIWVRSSKILVFPLFIGFFVVVALVVTLVVYVVFCVVVLALLVDVLVAVIFCVPFP